MSSLGRRRMLGKAGRTEVTWTRSSCLLKIKLLGRWLQGGSDQGHPQSWLDKVWWKVFPLTYCLFPHRFPPQAPPLVFFLSVPSPVLSLWNLYSEKQRLRSEQRSHKAPMSPKLRAMEFTNDSNYSRGMMGETHGGVHGGTRVTIALWETACVRISPWRPNQEDSPCLPNPASPTPSHMPFLSSRRNFQKFVMGFSFLFLLS